MNFLQTDNKFAAPGFLLRCIIVAPSWQRFITQKLPSFPARNDKYSKNIFFQILHRYLLIKVDCASYFRSGWGEIMTMTLAILERRRSNRAFQLREIHSVIVEVGWSFVYNFLKRTRWVVAGSMRINLYEYGFLFYKKPRPKLGTHQLPNPEHWFFDSSAFYYQHHPPQYLKLIQKLRSE